MNAQIASHLVPVLGIALAILLVWVTTRGRRLRMCEKQAAERIAFDLLITPPEKIFLDMNGLCAFAQIDASQTAAFNRAPFLAVAFVSGVHLAARKITPADITSWQKRALPSGRMKISLRTGDFSHSDFDAEFTPDAAEDLANILARMQSTAA